MIRFLEIAYASLKFVPRESRVNICINEYLNPSLSDETKDVSRFLFFIFSWRRFGFFEGDAAEADGTW